ncbi:hypothetical protein B0H14DRAFT_2593467 [Mycena olivaceomarginata]|nr:hypothetical protein B0H14DRAFT_2593467 [Mycena olivaceomarginata]
MYDPPGQGPHSVNLTWDVQFFAYSLDMFLWGAAVVGLHLDYRLMCEVLVLQYVRKYCRKDPVLIQLVSALKVSKRQLPSPGRGPSSIFARGVLLQFGSASCGRGMSRGVEEVQEQAADCFACIQLRASSILGLDMNIEHMIGKIKVTQFLETGYHAHREQELFAAKGVYGGWDRLANISAVIHVLDSIQTSMAASLGASYSGTGHKDVDTSDLVLPSAGSLAQKTRGTIIFIGQMDIRFHTHICQIQRLDSYPQLSYDYIKF